MAEGLPNASDLLGGVTTEPEALEGQPICRYCLQPADTEPDGQLTHPCACTAGVHQRCLVAWLFHSHRTGRANAERCEICNQSWAGMNVPVETMTEQLASLRNSVPADAEMRARFSELELLVRLLATQATTMALQVDTAGATAQVSSAAQEQAEADRDRHAARATVLFRSKTALEDRVAALEGQAQSGRWWKRNMIAIGILCFAVGLGLGLPVGASVTAGVLEHRRRRKLKAGQQQAGVRR